MKFTMTCDEVRLHLFDFKEEKTDVALRQRIYAHLATCSTCREEERAELALTGMLTAHRARTAGRRRSFLPMVGAVAAAVLLLIFTPTLFEAEQTAFGSITSYDLDINRNGAKHRSRKLKAEELIELSAGAFATCTLEGAGGISTTGPTCFVLKYDGGLWELEVLEGDVNARVEKDGALLVRAGMRNKRLEVGYHALTAIQWTQEEQEKEKRKNAAKPAELLQQAMSLYYDPSTRSNGLKEFQTVAAHEYATKEQVREARFYIPACLAKEGRTAEALALGEKYIKDYPQDSRASVKRFFLGLYAWRLGDFERAKMYWRHMMKDEGPDSNLTQAALDYLKGPQADESHAPNGAETIVGRKLSGELGVPEKKGGYLVVKVRLEQRPGFAAVADLVAQHHNARMFEFDGVDFKKLQAVLVREKPENVLFVVPPDVLDVNLHRRILLLSYGLDKDITTDFCFGYFTAKNAQQLSKLWSRTVAAHEKKPSQRRRWVGTGVTSGIKSIVYADRIPGVAQALGYKGEQIYWSCIEADPNVFQFIDKNISRLESADIVTFTGNSDPQGIWLFNDQRNIQKEKHWPYSPEKVGHDPRNEMPRIMASRFAALSLNSPIVWSGTCHSAATGRVFVEGDIVSTFGSTDNKGTLHILDPSKSLGLAMIEAGATAYLAPIAANHGMSVSMEVDFAFIHGASLGETIKATYDGIALAGGGRVVLDFVEEGKHILSREGVMAGGGANRILIGDPALRPFGQASHPLESVVIKNKKKDGFDIEVEWRGGWHARSWDIYRNHRKGPKIGRARIPVRVDLAGYAPLNKKLQFNCKAEARSNRDELMPYTLTHCVPETFHGRRYLHLQMNSPREAVDRKAVTATFHVTYK